MVATGEPRISKYMIGDFGALPEGSRGGTADPSSEAGQARIAVANLAGNACYAATSLPLPERLATLCPCSPPNTTRQFEGQCPARTVLPCRSLSERRPETSRMATTRTGSFPIGFRNNVPHWGETPADAVRFMHQEGFETIDLAGGTDQGVGEVLDAGLTIGTIDLVEPFSDMLEADAGTRRACVERNTAFITDLAARGVKTFFTVMFAPDPSVPRPTALGYAIESYGALCEAVGSTGARFVIEGWPGPAPHHPCLACTPESCRAMLDGVGHAALGLNFDPSHLLRMGINPERFVDDFADRIYHVHAKDTEILTEDLYAYGTLQPGTTGQPREFGGHHWRYCIPGHGVARWTHLLQKLTTIGYSGPMSIELEDENFYASPDRWEAGLIAARDFLIHA